MMQFKFISHDNRRYRIRTISARNEDDAWEMIEDFAPETETGLLIPLRAWKQILRRDSPQT